MEDSEAVMRYDRLVKDLALLLTVLDEAGEHAWATWFRTAASEVLAQDAHGLSRLRSAFGGMGSFSDLMLSVPGDQEASLRLNLELDQLRTRIYDDATCLSIEVQKTQY